MGANYSDVYRSDDATVTDARGCLDAIGGVPLKDTSCDEADLCQVLDFTVTSRALEMLERSSDHAASSTSSDAAATHDGEPYLPPSESSCHEMKAIGPLGSIYEARVARVLR